MRALEDCILYGFVDAAYLNGRDPLVVGRQLCEGGADLIQLRAKTWSLDQIHQVAVGLRRVTHATGAGLVINDHPGIALQVGADLCHLGQEDFLAQGHRHVSELVPGPAGLRLGLSTHAPEQAEHAVRAGAAYLAVGPVYPTATKPGRPPVTLDYVRWAADNLRLPWFAIGGITLRNVDEVLAAGARRICVVSAILNAPDVAEACQQFRQRLTCAL